MIPPRCEHRLRFESAQSSVVRAGCGDGEMGSSEQLTGETGRGCDMTDRDAVTSSGKLEDNLSIISTLSCLNTVKEESLCVLI